MHSNNEVGSIQPIKEISMIAKKNNIVIHTDAAQSLGKVLVSVDDLGVDMLTFVGHKLYAPKGIGALYIRKGIVLEKFMHGAGHESNKRAGTENVIHIVGLGKACEIAKRDYAKNYTHMKILRDKLHSLLKEKIPDIRLNGHPDNRLPNTLSLGFREAKANLFISELQDTVAISAGAACHSDHIKISYVLEAMQVPVEYAKGTLRISTGKYTTLSDIEIVATALVDIYYRHFSKH